MSRTLRLHCIIDVLFFYEQSWQLNTQTVVARHSHNWSNFTGCIKTQDALFFALCHFNLWSRNEVNIVLTHGQCQILWDGILDRLRTRGAKSDLGLQQLSRSLALAKSRNTNLISDFAEGLIDISIEFDLVNFH